jgi:ATP-binding cassette subfamily B protein
VDPSAQLWNKGLEENLRYGAGNARELSSVLDVVAPLGLPLDARLGEGGTLVSGGEGQRVRFARALLREGIRLALLDEPFRGLDRENRAGFLRRAREHWKEATLFAVTHDISECRSFDRVLVLERGRLVEDGPPEELLAQSGSRLRALLELEEELLRLWGDRSWRHLRIEKGRLVGA